MKILALGSLFIILAFGLSKISLYLLNKFKIVDIPNPRGMHHKPIPRGGGISILISLIIYFVFIHNSFSFNDHIYAYISLVCISILGFIDDLKSINFKIRLIFQFIFSILIIYSFSLDSLYELFDTNLLLVVYLILIIFIVWQINLFNFMDGINGICTIQAILFFLLMSLITFFNEHYYFTQKYLIFGCILVGFLPLNFPKALVFLGDCGSYLLGALIAYSTIEVLYLGVEFFLIGIILMSAFYLDATITLL
jgi:Fuc2NAc and GlcNAc transferase